MALAICALTIAFAVVCAAWACVIRNRALAEFQARRGKIRCRVRRVKGWRRRGGGLLRR